MKQRNRTTALLLLATCVVLSACGDDRAINEDGTCGDSTLHSQEQMDRLTMQLQYSRDQREQCEVARALEQESREFLTRNGNQFWCSRTPYSNPSQPYTGLPNAANSSSVSSQSALQALEYSRSIMTACGYPTTGYPTNGYNPGYPTNGYQPGYSPYRGF